MPMRRHTRCEGRLLGVVTATTRSSPVRTRGPEAARRKEAAFACHRSQTGNLGLFGFGPERFRAAPIYDFSRPPPGSEVMYGVEVWRGLSRAFAAATQG